MEGRLGPATKAFELGRAVLEGCPGLWLSEGAERVLLIMIMLQMCVTE